MRPAFIDEAALFCALGLYVRSNETLRLFGKARVDVKLGHHDLMRVIFIIGEKYVNARMNLAYFTSDRDSQHYTSFDPTRNGYIHWPILDHIYHR